MDLLITTSSPCLFLCGGPFSYFLITFKIYLREMRVHVRLEVHGYNGYNGCNDWGGELNGRDRTSKCRTRHKHPRRYVAADGA